MRGPRLSAAVLIVMAYSVLLVGWAIGNPPFAGADEVAHYERAISIGHGELIGSVARQRLHAGASAQLRLEYQWINDANRSVTVPAGSLLPHAACNAQEYRQSARCVDQLRPDSIATRVVTPVGNYQPEGYFAAAVPMRLAQDPIAADRLGRLGCAALCVLFLLLAVRQLSNGDPGSLIGLLLAVTPMALFTNAIINPSGLEIIAAIAFAASVLALRRPGRDTVTTWAIAALCGAVLALSRSPGPIWVIACVALLVALLGRAGTVALVKRRPVAAWSSIAVWVGAIVVNQLWEHAYGSTLRLTPGRLAHQLVPAVRQLQNLVHQEIGNFGTLDSPIAFPLLVVWLVTVMALVAAALRLGTARERVVLISVIVLNPIFVVAFYAVFTAGSGFGGQGRHVLPFGVLVPLLAGETLTAHRTEISAAKLQSCAAVVAFIAAVVQVLAWYGNARRQAVGAAGPLWFIPHAQWSPPLGWWFWLITVIVGGLLLATTGAPLATIANAVRTRDQDTR